MQDPQDANIVAVDTVGDDVWRAVDDEFSRAVRAAYAATFRKLDEPFHLRLNAFIDRDGGLGTIGFNVSKMASRSSKANADHSKRIDYFFTLPRAEARRLAKWVATSS